ncbi:hypothetical protein TRVL_08306 [Trypanosoma vivax]|nr:hypothetical protein TRVL_08306 [Trypanosoma vivax]
MAVRLSGSSASVAGVRTAPQGRCVGCRGAVRSVSCFFPSQSASRELRAVVARDEGKHGTRAGSRRTSTRHGTDLGREEAESRQKPTAAVIVVRTCPTRRARDTASEPR